MKPLQVGELVEHPAWGRGKVLAIDHQNANVLFPSKLSAEGGPVIKVRLQMLARSDVQSDPAVDAIILKARSSGRARASVPRVHKRLEHDLDRSIAWFLREYPGTFTDPKLVKHELTYKREAHQFFVDQFGNGGGAQLLENRKGDEIGRVFDALWHRTNIPSRFEVMAAHDGLKDASAALRLLDALLLLLDAPGAEAFSRYSDAVASLPAPATGSRVHTWPNVTIVPFLADPSTFMVLKPQVVRRVANRMGRDLAYSATVKWDTYERTLEMSRHLLEALAPLGATDFIDVQSFMWVTRRLA